MTRFVPPVLIVLFALVALVLGGTAPFGRLALELGMPKLAILLLDDPHWKGVAMYRAEDFNGSAEVFAQAGPEAAYNSGNALARASRYAEAMEAYDITLAQNPNDAEALANFDLIKSFYAGVRIELNGPLITEEKTHYVEDEANVGQGQARAQGTGEDATNSGTNLGIPMVLSNEQQQVSRVFDAQFVEANERWLATLEDEPGRYLAARILAERKSRMIAGTGMQQEGSPW